MSRSLSVAIFCGVVLGVLGLGACAGDDPATPPNNTGGSSGQGGGGESGAGNTGGMGATGGASGAGATGGGGGMGDTGGMGVTGGAGGMGVTGGSGGMGGGDGDGDGSSWTHLGYDPANNYNNPHDKTISAANAAMLEEKWVFPVQDGAVMHGGVIIAEGKVFATSSAGVYAINLADGTQAWHRPELVSDGSAAYADGAVFVHTQPAELWKLNAADGATLWGPIKTYDLVGADGTSSPVVANGKVVVGHSAGVNEVGAAAATSFGGVEAFNVDDGTDAWTYNTCEGDENGAMTWSTVSIDVAANVVYASTGNNYTIGGANSDAIHAIDLGTGDGLWKKQVREGDTWSLFTGGSEDTDFGANPILAQIGDRKVVAAGDKATDFWVLDREMGDVIDSRKDLTSSHSANLGGVLNNGAYDGSTFYVISNDAGSLSSKLYALKQEDLEDKWAPISYDKIVWGMPSLANGVLYAPINDTLEVIDSANGTTLKSFPLGGTVGAGQPAIAAGRVVVKSGMTYGFAGGTAIPNNKVFCFGLPD